MVFGMFGSKKKISDATDAVMLLLGSQLNGSGEPLFSAIPASRALVDKYLLGYVAGACRAAAEISSLSDAQMGEIFLDVTKRLLGAADNQHAQFHLHSMRQKSEASLSGTEDGYFEVRALLGAYIGGGKASELQKLQSHMNRDYYSTDVPAIEPSLGDAREADLTWDQWYAEFKHHAGLHNEKLKVNDEGRSFIDFLDHEPLKRAHSDKVDPSGLAKDFADQFDMDEYLPG